MRLVFTLFASICIDYRHLTVYNLFAPVLLINSIEEPLVYIQCVTRWLLRVSSLLKYVVHAITVSRIRGVIDVVMMASMNRIDTVLGVYRDTPVFRGFYCPIYAVHA